jgi:uncharacterized protein involved in exopolysaccharide biosynthesis
LRQEGEVRGEIRGEIKTYQKLIESGPLSREALEQKIAQLNRELEKLTKESATYPEQW